MNDSFENILGQPQVRDLLRSSVIAERVTHAYLFVGPVGSNKTQAAFALAQALMCPKGPHGPRGGLCGACDACGKILRRKHPDVHYCAPEGAQGYLVEQIREIVNDTALAPIQANKKIYILDRVDQLNAAAANAFLKTLEEPPANVVLILLARTREAVLPTILSRCQVVPFRFIPPHEAAGIVAQNASCSVEKAKVAIEACGGSVTNAIAFLNQKGNKGSEQLLELFGSLAQLRGVSDWQVLCLAQTIVAKAKAPLDEVRAGLEAELAQNADFLSKSAMRQLEARNKRELTAKTLEYLRRTMAIVRSWLRDGMMVASGSSHLVINYEVRETLEDLFAHADPAALAAVIEKSFASEQALSYNVSPETCIDTLLFDVREVLDGSRCAH